MKILVISSDTKSLIDFRGDLMKELIVGGNKVFAVAPENSHTDNFARIGVVFFQINFDRTGKNPINDLKFYKDISKIIMQIKPDLVLSYAIKPVIYGSLAARKNGVSNIYSLLPGLGYAFNFQEKSSLKDKLLKIVVIRLLRAGCKCNNAIMVQNPDDLRELVNYGIVQQNVCHRVNASGVNLEQFVPTELPSKPMFIMITRLLRDKGICEYIQAAREIKQKYPETKFMLLGPFDSNPSAINKKELEEMIDDGCVQYLGETEDVRPFISKASIFVLPSYYREGVPRSIQEAMAMGRAIITTDWIGCRETVKDGYNGFLIRPRNSTDLYEKMKYFIQYPQEIKRMGENSLTYCQEKFDVHIVNRQMMSIMGIHSVF